MADYYNKTRGPLPVTLSGGRVLMIPAKQWVTIAPEDEGGESLTAHVAHGDLHRSTVNTASAAAPSVVVPEVVAPSPPPPSTPLRAVAEPRVEVSGEAAEIQTEGSPEAATEKRPDDALRRRRRE